MPTSPTQVPQATTLMVAARSKGTPMQTAARSRQSRRQPPPVRPPAAAAAAVARPDIGQRAPCMSHEAQRLQRPRQLPTEQGRLLLPLAALHRNKLRRPSSRRDRQEQEGAAPEPQAALLEQLLVAGMLVGSLAQAPQAPCAAVAAGHQAQHVGLVLAAARQLRPSAVSKRALRQQQAGRRWLMVVPVEWTCHQHHHHPVLLLSQSRLGLPLSTRLPVLLLPRQYTAAGEQYTTWCQGSTNLVATAVVAA